MKEFSVSLTQYIRPNGKQAPTSIMLPGEIAEMAYGMILSVEVNQFNKVILYARLESEIEEEESIEIADNGPGKKNPKTMLIKLIERVNERRSNESTSN